MFDVNQYERMYKEISGNDNVCSMSSEELGKRIYEDRNPPPVAVTYSYRTEPANNDESKNTTH